MRKIKQIGALAAMLLCMIMYTTSVYSATCFLPDESGDCGNSAPNPCDPEDDSCNGGGKEGEKCEGYNISESDKNSAEYNSSCYSCSSCKRTRDKATVYKCDLKDGATWYPFQQKCCTDGEKYNTSKGKCCPASGCEEECKSGEVTTNGTCCESGQHADGAICCASNEHNDQGICCASDEHNSNGICCPTNKHNENGVCVCDEPYVRCDEGCCKETKCTGYELSQTEVSKYDTNCYKCEACTDDTTKYKCTQSLKDGYTLNNGVCEKQETCPSGYSKSVSCATDLGFTLFEHPSYTGCYQCQCRNQGIINGKCTNCTAEGYTQTQKDGDECTDPCPLNSNLYRTCTQTCPTGYSTSTTSVSQCASSSNTISGWTVDRTTVSGQVCGKCVAKSCPSGYYTSTTASSCSSNQSFVTNGYSGDKACGNCVATETKCPEGAYETQEECQKHVLTRYCDKTQYGGACKKGSVSGCWKPFSTMPSKAILKCSANNCSLGFCKEEDFYTSNYFGSACVLTPKNPYYKSQWYSSNSGFYYPDTGIVNCTVSKGKKDGTNCASAGASASSICSAEMIIGKSPYEQDNGKW